MEKNYRVNHQIKAKVVNLVLSDGVMRETVPLSEALQIAEEKALDLVEVSNKQNQMPVCKILDYGKMKYKLSKKKKSQKQIKHTKEIKYSFNISDHDLAVKHKKIFEFISKHYMVKYVLELRGRENHMAKEALQKMNDHLLDFKDMASWKEPDIFRGGKRTTVSTILNPL